jgi:predicted metal-dependent peptidase
MQLIKACKELLIQQPFYGLFLLNLRKEIVSDNHPVKTAAVGPNGINFTLYVNETFWNNLTDTECIAVLTHELVHICLFHLTDDFKADNHDNMNIATDVVVNQIVTGLPDGCVTLQNLSKLIGKNLEPNRGAWYYYNEIQKFVKEHPEKCIPDTGGLANFKSIDNHDMWPKDISEAERKLYENQVKSKLKETEALVNKQVGHIPGELKEILEKIRNNPPVFNWRNYFRRVVGDSISSDLQLTRMRPSKRLPDARGTRLKRKPNICVVIDTSGSINMNDFSNFISEVNHIYKTGVDITIIECDTNITKICKYDKKSKFEFIGRGGTDVCPALDFYKEHKEFSSCVIFTDGYLSKFTFSTCKNLIWIITSDGNKSQKFPGITVLIP